ncbi:hypothetical protein DSO57_1032999 [Entomophthora muscae]|uniref:Uncharacterized protein n=2 Tax=Entomophthora muscae TaxID=34485 RepID=A0ACC2UL94_9FUNG|nr:hypothetical protein DSO57_1025405 [Entomophthora muscae]KAJ9087480.1 hypothetical protein DSO57_1032999 [Entomophthora muscae]
MDLAMGIVTWIKGSYLFTHLEVGKYTKRRTRNKDYSNINDNGESVYSNQSRKPLKKTKSSKKLIRAKWPGG